MCLALCQLFILLCFGVCVYASTHIHGAYDMIWSRGVIRSWRGGGGGGGRGGGGGVTQNPPQPPRRTGRAPPPPIPTHNPPAIYIYCTVTGTCWDQYKSCYCRIHHTTGDIYYMYKSIYPTPSCRYILRISHYLYRNKPYV